MSKIKDAVKGVLVPLTEIFSSQGKGRGAICLIEVILVGYENTKFLSNQ